MKHFAIAISLLSLFVAGCSRSEPSGNVSGSAGESKKTEFREGSSREADLIARGMRIYREGILPSGKPMTAIVAGDVEFQGTQFNCLNCHQASGLGSLEGDSLAPMVTEAALYNPKKTGPAPRPAYTDETLAHALREGIDSAERRLDELMPRFKISDSDMNALIAYLKQLSDRVSIGVTKEEIHFATVVTEGVDPRAMLEVLETFFREKNNELRNPVGRRRSGPFYRRQMDQAYRKWRLHKWTLTGPADTWKKQLEAHYLKQPVFALISGMSSGGWQPIHDFCEEHEIPSVLPNTDLPALSDEDYYTVYFSRGLYLEAGAVAANATKLPLEGPVLQVYRTGSTASGVAPTLRSAVVESGRAAVFDLELGPDQEVSEEVLRKKADELEAGAIVLWLGRSEIKKLASWISRTRQEIRIYLSSTLLGGMDAVPESVQSKCIVAHPYCLEDDFLARFHRVEFWLSRKHIPVTDRRIMAQTYFACMLVGESLMHVRFEYFFRKYFLENIDHMTSRLGAFCASHPSPSFGPGQRYLSKGCYILSPTQGGEGALWVEWIVL